MRPPMGGLGIFGVTSGMAFFQDPPRLGNTFATDPLLGSLVDRLLAGAARDAVTAELTALGELAGGEYRALQEADRANEPVLTHWDAWGNRIDHIEVSPLWKRAEAIAAERGIVATAYERRHGACSRLHQMALVYLFGPSTDVYACPLAMTDGAARTLLDSGNQALIARAVPRLTSRDPATFWTSGQW